MYVESLAANDRPFELPPVASTTTSTNSPTASTTLLARQTPNLPPGPISGFSDLESFGEYTCDSSFNATTLLSVFESWITSTDTDLGARIIFLSFNLHEISPPSNNTNLPAPDSLLQILQNTGILADAYTPVELASDRSDLNSSWFGGRADGNTSEYFTIQNNAGGLRSTENGWPSESYLEFSVKKRLLVSFGTIAAGLGYDPVATGDDRNIFPASYLGEPAIFNSSMSPKCYFSSSKFELKEANSSWAQLVDTTLDPFPKGNSGNITDLASCGYSATLNSTYSSNVTANVEYYFGQIRDALAWSWDVNEPANRTGEDTENTFRCASMSASNGRWKVTDCGERKLAACRVKSGPYDVSYILLTFPDERPPLIFCSGYSRIEMAHTTMQQVYVKIPILTLPAPHWKMLISSPL